MSLSRWTLSMFAFLALLFSARPGIAQDRPYTEGTVWEVTYVRTEPGRTEDYLKNLQANWKRVNDAAIEKGYIVSYKILSSPPGDQDDWDLLLLVEYPNMAVFDGADEKFDPIAESLVGARSQQQQATVERGQLRTIMGERLARELVLK
ncbi:MAG TPA: hypothetical protein VM737_06115 [Gemmatimonadota bacterium]|nr:hypothetical protein [Gemmatimonadota bacterium]